MRFPRNARIFRGQLDAAPFAIVFFLLVLFVMLTTLVYTPGVRVPLQLPMASDLPGTDKPTVAVAVEDNGRLFYENEEVSESKLVQELKRACKSSREPLALLIRADAQVRHETLIRLTLLAREAGMTEAWLATLPQPYAGSGASKRP